MLNAFHSRIDLLQQKEYKALRSAGMYERRDGLRLMLCFSYHVMLIAFFRISIFVEGINKRYFKGLSPQEYNHKKARRYIVVF